MVILKKTGARQILKCVLSSHVHCIVGCPLICEVRVVARPCGIVNLWLGKPDEVRFARRYRLTYLIANIAYFVFWTLVVRPTQMLGLAEMGWYHVVGPIASTALWYFYLGHSKRVRDTYRHG